MTVVLGLHLKSGSEVIEDSVLANKALLQPFVPNAKIVTHAV